MGINKNILFLNFNCTWNPHLETDLELMLKLSKEGHNVYSLSCNKVLNNSCISSTAYYADDQQNLSALCERCVKRYHIGIDLLNISKFNILKLEEPTQYPEYVYKKYNTVNSVKNINYEGVNVGFGVLENILNTQKTLNINFKELEKEILNALKSNYIIYYNVKNIINNYNIDEIYVFNGRFSEYSVVINICEAFGLNYFLHERGANKDKYLLLKNKRLHYLNTYIKELEKSISCYDSSKESIAKDWFEQRRKGHQQSWLSFTYAQEKQRLPLGFNIKKKNITFYNSSTWEHISYEDWWPKKCFEDEMSVLKQVSDAFMNDPDYHFYFRVHPNLSLHETEQIEPIRTFARNCPDNVTLVGSFEKIDTYELLDKSDIIVSFNSTVGVEACYWNKPSILLGNAIYQNIDVCYRPQSMDEFIDMIKKDLRPKNRENALLYGYWFNTLGEDFKHYKAYNLFDGEFLGTKIPFNFHP